MKTYKKYKLVNSYTRKEVDSKSYSLTDKEASTINYAYGLNGFSKKMVPIQ